MTTRGDVMQAYDDVIEGVARAYGDRATAILRTIRDKVRAAGMGADDESFDLSGDDYSWGIRVWRTPDTSSEEDCIDVRLEVAEARSYGGDGGAFGISFALDVVEWGGRILGGLSPYNYTDECWIDARDAEAIEERFAIIEGADVSGIVDLLRED